MMYPSLPVCLCRILLHNLCYRRLCREFCESELFFRDGDVIMIEKCGEKFIGLLFFTFVVLSMSVRVYSSAG